MQHRNSDNFRRGATYLGHESLEATRQLTIKLVNENRSLEKDDLFVLFQSTILTTEERQHDVDWYFFANAYQAAKSRPNVPAAPTDVGQAAIALAAHREAAAVRLGAVGEAAAKVAHQISLLFLTMPNGKAMRYCTGREMEKFGKGYAKIAKKAGAKTVGEVMNEGEVKELMDE